MKRLPRPDSSKDKYNTYFVDFHKKHINHKPGYVKINAIYLNPEYTNDKDLDLAILELANGGFNSLRFAQNFNDFWFPDNVLRYPQDNPGKL